MNASHTSLVPTYNPDRSQSTAGRHHDAVMLQRLLESASCIDPLTGAAYDEVMLTGLSGGIGFMYAVFEYAQMDPIVTLVMRRHPADWVEAALHHTSATFEVVATASASKAQRSLDAALDAGCAAQVTVLRDGLAWHAIPMMTGGPWVVNVIGRSGDVYVIDDVGPEPQTISQATLARLRSLDKKVKHRAVTITGSRDVDPLAELRDALADTVRVFTGPVLGHSFDVNFGLTGLDRFATALEDTTTKRGWTRLAGRRPQAAFACLRRLHDCIEYELSAHGAMRGSYGEFCGRAADALGSNSLATAAELWTESARSWSQLAAASVDVPGVLSQYRDLAAKRHVALHRGATPEEMSSFSAQIAELDAETAPQGGQLADLLAALARIVRTIEATETEAIACMGEACR